MNDNDRLNEILQETVREAQADYTIKMGNMSAPAQSNASISEMINKSDIRQWAVGGNDTFRPISSAIPKLQPAIYQFGSDNSGLYIQKIRVITDDLIVLPDTVNERLLVGMDKFWKSKEKYVDRGLLYKRGVFLWGPPGGGKTASLQLLVAQLIRQGGIVINCTHPELAAIGLAAVRRIEPDRNIIVILEDMDEIVNMYGEHTLLALLDGENQVGNVVFIATSNYPERLGARILNRPSRFDERYFVDMPGVQAREVYIRHIAPELSDDDVTKWVLDTDKMSVAHLRELAAAVLCLDQDYADVIDRLKSMRIKPREVSGFNNNEGVGFIPGLSSQSTAAPARFR